MTHNPIASFTTNRLQALWHDVGRIDEPFRLQAKQQQAAQQAKLAGQKTIQPAAQEQADAEQAAAETQLIDTFTRFVQQNP